jgi:hypothetical protein
LTNCNKPSPRRTIGRVAYGVSEAPPDRLSIVGVGCLARSDRTPGNRLNDGRDQKSVLNQLRSLNRIRRFEPYLSSGGGLSTSAGSVLPWERRDVTYDAEFKWSLHPDDPLHTAIVAALLQETRGSLLATGAQIVSEQADDGGFSIVYRAGRCIGHISAVWPKKSSGPEMDGPFTLTVRETFRV